MEFLILLLLILFFLLLHKELRDSSKRTRQDLRRVEERLEQLEGKGSPSESSKAEEEAKEISSPAAETDTESPPSAHSSEAGQVRPEESEKKGASDKDQEKKEVPEEKVRAEAPHAGDSDSLAQRRSQKAGEQPRPQPTQKEKRERDTEWERFIGENLINKIGIGVLVLGIAFFVRYAIDQGWLGELGRVLVGLLAGGGLIVLGHRLRERFKAFSSVLAGGGLAVHYFSITIAFQEYQLFSQTWAFILMLVITAFAVFLSLLYDKQELAVIALLGGFGTPFMVSTGEGSYVVLFCYLIVLNLGMLTLAYQRHWTVVNLLSYIATVLIYGSWLFRESFTEEGPPFPGSFLFATIYFLIFYLMALAYKVRKGLSFRAQDLSILISCNALFFAAGMGILSIAMEGAYQGLFTIGLAGVNLLFVLRYHYWKKVDQNLFSTLVGLTLTFVTLAVPVQFQGDHITLFWSAEAVLLLWLAQRSGISLLRLGSALVSALMLVSLWTDWQSIYVPILSGSEEGLTPLANPGFVTGLVAVASLGLNYHLLRFERGAEFFNGVPLGSYRGLVIGFLVVVAYGVPMLEIYAQTYLRIWEEALQHIIRGSYHFLAISIILFIALHRAPLSLRRGALLVGLLLSLSYVFFYQEQIVELQKLFLLRPHIGIFEYLLHFLLIAGVLLVLYRSWGLLKSIEEKLGEYRTFFRWFATFIVVFVASAELDQSVLWIQSPGSDLAFQSLRAKNAMIAYPILWGLSSFLLMWYGLRKKLRDFRIIALALFALTLLKLFLFDIQDISEVGRVIAFISLGILLLVVSFMYQKLKGIVLDEDEEK